MRVTRWVRNRGMDSVPARQPGTEGRCVAELPSCCLEFVPNIPQNDFRWYQPSGVTGSTAEMVTKVEN